MTKYSDILGMNTRNLNYLRLNKSKGRKIADSKIKTKYILRKNNIPHPKLFGLIKKHSQLADFNWLKLKTGFVIKPNEGFGGEGILVVKKTALYAGEWWRMDGKKINIDDLKIHAGNILEGQYSRNRTPDEAVIEERVKIHPKFRRYANGGTPDIRVIVYNNIPVMAMLRLPTKESNGKANLHQGAIALGIDMATGITTYGVHHNNLITNLPEKHKKVNGITIPNWEKLLKVAVDTQIATGLGYVGVDIVIDKEQGPMVLEVNYQPGLQIQVANRRGLFRRLKRVEGLSVGSKYKGIKIAQLLFAESFSDKVKIQQGRPILGIFENIRLLDAERKWHDFTAKIDTGAYSVSIDKKIAKELGLLSAKNILYKNTFRSALGKKQERPVIETVFKLRGRKVKALTNITDRGHMNYQILIGRRYLRDFMIDPSLSDIEIR